MPVSRLHFLLPFSLPSSAAAQAALAHFSCPAFERLMARATLTETLCGDDFQRTLPHERWLAQQFGVTQNDAASSGSTHHAPPRDDAPLAPYMLLADGGKPGDAVWACVEPVHLHVAHDHLILSDPASLALCEHDAATLYAVARPLLEEAGVHVQAPTLRRWYLSGDMFGSLAGASPLRASGRSIEIWLPHDTRTGKRSRVWMKLQNEIQMAWFGHPVNEAREARGLPAINSLWFHAQGTLRPAVSHYALVLSDAVATRGLALAAQTPCADVPADFAALTAIAPQNTPDAASDARRTVLLELAPCAAAFAAQDWQRWRAGFAALERSWFAPALAALTAGNLAEIRFTLCGDTSTATLRTTRGDLRRFWRRRAFASLCAQ